MDKSKDSVKVTVKVPISASDAFNAFIDDLHSWWPKEYTWAGDVLERIKIEPKENGRCFERGPYGFECDWGRVLKWNPPHRIIFSWQISPNRVPEPNPEKASEVEIQFKEISNKATKINFEHRNFDNHGKDAETYKKALNSPQGWPYIIDNYKKLVAQRYDN